MRSISDTVFSRLGYYMSGPREQHVRRVVHTASELAMRFSLPGEKVRAAAVFHDLDRELGAGPTLARASDWGIRLLAVERRSPVLAHGAITAERMFRQYGLQDTEVLMAVRHHTLGHPDLGAVGLALYVADFCEPGRKHLSNEDRTAILAETTLPAMVRRIIDLSRLRFGALEAPTWYLYERMEKEL